MITFPMIANGLRDLMTPAQGPLKTYKEIKELKSLFTNRGSIIRLIKNFLIEPTIFVSKSLREQCPDKEFDAINDQLDLFCSFYAQAFKILTGIYDIEARVAVEMLGTSGFDYNLGDAIEDMALKGAGLNSLSMDDTISKFNNQSFLSFGLLHGLDDPRSSNFAHGLLADDKSRKEYLDEAQAMIDNNRLSTLKSSYAGAMMTNQQLRNDAATKDAFDSRARSMAQARAGQGIHLANRQNDGSYGHLGKLHEQGNYGYQMREFVITIVKGDPRDKCVIEIPITVKANLVFVKAEEVINALMPKHDDKGIMARWDKWRSGGIKFWKDLVLCSDLIREYKQNKLKDKEDIMGKINSSEIAGMTKGAMTGQVGYERFYNMYLTTASDKTKIESFLRGKMDNPKFKENFLIKANGLSMMCLDPEWEIAQVYIKDINKPSIIKFDRLGKRKAKDGSLNELFKSLFSQQAPVF